MAERVRIYNEAKHDIGLINQTGIEYNIKPKMFISLGKDDAEYMVAIARNQFMSGKLRLDDADMTKDLGLLEPGTESPYSEIAVRKALSGTVKSLKKWLSDIEDVSIAEVIYQVANEMDLPVSKMNALKEAFPNKFED